MKQWIWGVVALLGIAWVFALPFIWSHRQQRTAQLELVQLAYKGPVTVSLRERISRTDYQAERVKALKRIVAKPIPAKPQLDTARVKKRQGEALKQVAAIEATLKEQQLADQKAKNAVEAQLQQQKQQESKRNVAYGLFLLLGIVAKELWDHINDTNRVGLRFPRLVAALVIAPIIYGAVYSQWANTDPGVTVLGSTAAFQNGFFWQAVFRTVQAAAAQHGVGGAG